MWRVTIYNGERIKSHEVIVHDDTKEVNIYDSTGENVYSKALHKYNSDTGAFELQHVDEWLLDGNGEIIKDYKQFGENGNIMMNNMRRKNLGILGDMYDAYNKNNFFKKSGCLLTSYSIIDSFFGGEYDTPDKIDQFADENGQYYSKYSANVIRKNISEDLGYSYSQLKDNNIDNYRSAIDFNLGIGENVRDNPIPTGIKFSRNPRDSHFAVISGARYYADGTHDYLVRDPGSSKDYRQILDGKTLKNKRGPVKEIFWLTKE